MPNAHSPTACFASCVADPKCEGFVITNANPAKCYRKTNIILHECEANQP